MTANLTFSKIDESSWHKVTKQFYNKSCRNSSYNNYTVLNAANIQIKKLFSTFSKSWFLKEEFLVFVYVCSYKIFYIFQQKE